MRSLRAAATTHTRTAKALLVPVVHELIFTVRVSNLHLQFSDQIEWSVQGIKNVIDGGFVFYGGFLGAMFGLWICKKFLGNKIDSYLSEFMWCLPFGHGIRRIGCFLVGCCYGCVWNGPFAVVYRYSFVAPNGVPLFPIQLVETGIELMLASILFFCRKKWKKADSVCFYRMSYALCRFFLEYMRYDTARGLKWGLSTSQWISIPVFLDKVE